MLTMAAIAGPRQISGFATIRGVVIDGEFWFSGKAKRVELRHFGLLPALSVASSRASSPSLWFRVAALPEDDVAVEAAEVLDEPAVAAPAYAGPTIKVKFELQKECHFGQQFKVVGGDSQIGDWDPSAAIVLKWSEGHLWTAEVDIPEGKTVEYKYVLTDQEGVVAWQPGSNHLFETAAGAEPLVLSEPWEKTQSESSAEPEVQSAESDTGDWDTFSSDAEVSSPAEKVADAAASATVGTLNAGIKAATALQGGLDAISDSPSSKTNGVAESKEESSPTAIEIPVVNSALAATAEPAAPVEEPPNTDNGASIPTSSRDEFATTEKYGIEESRVEAQPTMTEEQPTMTKGQPTIEKRKKRFNFFQKDLEWLSKIFFGRK